MTANESLLDVLLDSWDRNNRILVNLLGLVPEGGLAARAMDGGQPMDRRYDHPILFLQHMIWHEGHHHGQIKLALKLAGQAIPDKQAGPGTWGVWMRKTPGAAPPAAG